MKVALTIAGSDPSGGAGVQADIKTMTLNGVYAQAVIAALTAQNTLGVYGSEAVSPQFLKSQLCAVFGDIFPDAVKIGMLGTEQNVVAVAEILKKYNAVNVVVDPVMAATSGASLADDGARKALAEKLLPLAALVTPNIPEAEYLAGIKIDGAEQMKLAAKKISSQCGAAVLVKGGHLAESCDDVLFYNGEITVFGGERVQTSNSHGTGCTLSSAIAANLAKGFGLKTSVLRAKRYLTGALKYGLNLGKGSGPVNHAFNLTGEFAAQAESLDD